MRECVLFLLLGTLWGGSFVAIKIAIVSFDPAMAAAIRVGISLAFLSLLFAVQRRSVSVPRHLQVRLWIAGLFMQAIPFALLFWAEQNVSAGFAGVMNGTVPLFTYLLARFTTSKHELGKLSTRLGIAVGLVGMLVINLPGLSLGTSVQELLAMLAMLGVVLAYATGNLMNKRLLSRDNISRQAAAFHQHVSSVIFLAICAFLTNGLTAPPPLNEATRASWMAIIYLAIFSSALAWLMYFHLIHVWGVVKASAVTYLVPAVALILDYAYFGVLPTFTEIWGAILILIGVLLVQNPFVRREPKLISPVKSVIRPT
jgi:drug/metabolite transporter (DMT)-like permease